MQFRLLRAALSAAVMGCTGGLLGACADLHADVHARNQAAQLREGATYALTHMPSQDANAAQPSIDTLLRDELAARGLMEATDSTARYLLSVAYDTRAATVGVATCTADACDEPAAQPARFGRRAYRHSLTLRFFERASGDEQYKVSAVTIDRNADALHATPVLIKSALAKLPFDAPPDWRVKLRQDTESGAPVVVSVQPLDGRR